MERKERVGAELDQWFESSSVSILDAMEKERLAVTKSLATLPETIRGQYLSRYDLATRNRSEMPLCTSWARLQPDLPDELAYNRGAVIMNGETLFHAYLQCKKTG